MSHLTNQPNNTWQEIKANIDRLNAGKENNMTEISDDYCFTKTTVMEYRPAQGLTACDDCNKDLVGEEVCYVDGAEGCGTLSWVVCQSCYLSNYAKAELDDDEINALFEEAAGSDGRAAPVVDQRSATMELTDFLPSQCTLMSISSGTVTCAACRIELCQGSAAYFSKDTDLCTVCYNKRLAAFNALAPKSDPKLLPIGNSGRNWCTKCLMMDDNAAHAAEHAKETKPTEPIIQWIKAVLKVHDGREGDAQCGRPTCGKTIKGDEEAWFLGVSQTAPINCLECYEKFPPKVPTTGTVTTSFTTKDWGHHKHEPAEMICDTDDAWSLSVGSRDGIVAFANNFDIVMNLSGRSILETHVIPIPELAKWKHGGDTFAEMLLDWPDNGVAYFPLQFWLDVLEHLQIKKLKMVINCVGGHGRTGTALACMLIVSGICTEGDEAIKWVRANHCDRAIESAEQERYIRSIAKDMKEHTKNLEQPADNKA